MKLGQDGQPLSDDKLAALVGVPTRQQVIGWRQGKGMTRKYAERFAELDGEHTADDYMPVNRRQPATTADLERLEVLVARMEGLAKSLHRLQAQAADEILGQLEQQNVLLEQIEQERASLADERSAPPSRRPGRRSG